MNCPKQPQAKYNALNCVQFQHKNLDQENFMASRRQLLTHSAAMVGAASSGWLLPAHAQNTKLRIGLMLPYTGTFTQLGVAIDNGFRMALQEAGGKVEIK
jgi:ABC-type branched-subunit amino acid transport system substrate-binding protein